MFKKQYTTVLAMLTVFLLLAGTALAAEITVMNGTSFELHGLALSASESNDWGDDLLGDDILKPGEGLTINLSGSLSGWDMAVVDDEGQQLEFKNLNFSNVHKITLLSDGTAVFE